MALSPEALEAARLHRVEISSGSFGPGSEVIKIDGRPLNGVLNLSIDMRAGGAPVLNLMLHPLELEIDVEGVEVHPLLADLAEGNRCPFSTDISGELFGPACSESACMWAEGHDGPHESAEGDTW